MDPVRRPLALLALGLAATGLLACAQVFLLLEPDQFAPVLRPPAWLRPILLFGIGTGVAMIWAAFLVWRVEAYWFARLACILALLPCGVSCVIGLPLGLWGLSLLARPDVGRSFAHRAAYYRQELEEALDEFDADLRGP